LTTSRRIVSVRRFHNSCGPLSTSTATGSELLTALRGEDVIIAWADSTLTRAADAESIQCSLNTLISFVQNYGNDNRR